MKIMRKILCVLLCLSLVSGFSAFAQDTTAGDAAAKTDVAYTITNPYKDVNWEDANQYKTDLHSHTTASDGDDTLKESVERHLLHDFEILATTDHGTNNKGWADVNYSKFVYGFLHLFDKENAELEYLGQSGTFAGGLQYEVYTDPASGDEYVRTSDGREMMRIPFGIENNAVSINAHVNSWFAYYQNNTINCYEDAIKGVDKAGGLSVINHPGEYTKAKEDLTSEEAYNYDNWAYRYYINKFYGLLEKYPSCIGIDINSKGDSRTRYDRELWDILLERRTAQGKNVFAIATSDAHRLGIVNSGYTRLLMEEKTSAAARHSLENGEFFACSYYNGNYIELMNIQNGIKEFYGETDLYNTIKTVTDKMEKRVADVNSGAEDADSSLSYTLELVDGQGYLPEGVNETYITSVSVDDAEDTITVNTDNALIVRWIANGKQIAVSNAADGSCTIDLDDYSDEIGTYVRAEAFGEGGTVYTQAFVLSYDGAPEAQKYPYINIPVIDALFAELRTFGTVLKRVFTNLFN